MYDPGFRATTSIVVRRLTGVVATTQQSLRTQAAEHCVDHALPLGIGSPELACSGEPEPTTSRSVLAGGLR